MRSCFLQTVHQILMTPLNLPSMLWIVSSRGVCVCVCVCVCVGVYRYVCVHVYIHICVCVHICVYVHVYRYLCVCVCMCVSVYVWALCFPPGSTRPQVGGWRGCCFVGTAHVFSNRQKEIHACSGVEMDELQIFPNA